MTGLGTWLAALMGPLTAKILVALGFSVVSIVGVTAALNTLKGMLISNLALVPAAGLQLALLGGAGVGLGLIFGAVTFRMLLWQVSNTQRILGGG